MTISDLEVFKSRIFDRVSGIAWQLVDQTVLILEPRTKRAHELNHVASFIWTELDGERTVDDMIDAVAVEYDVARSFIEEEVIDFFTTLSEEVLIECR